MCCEEGSFSAIDQEKLRAFQEGNCIAIEESRLGLSKPLDLAALLARVEKRVAADQPQ